MNIYLDISQTFKKFVKHEKNENTINTFIVDDCEEVKRIQKSIKKLIEFACIDFSVMVIDDDIYKSKEVFFIESDFEKFKKILEKAFDVNMDYFNSDF